MKSISHQPKLIATALAATALGFPLASSSVRVNQDGHGQELIYPHYTARSVVAGNAFVTDFTVEPVIKAATDWIVTMPTKRFHVDGSTATPPFAKPATAASRGEEVAMVYFDREQHFVGGFTCFFAGICERPVSQNHSKGVSPICGTCKHFRF